MDDEETVVFFLAIFIGVVLTLIFVKVVGGFYGNGYQQAYEDLHNRKIETVVQKDYPALWIKYNAPKLPPNEREEYHAGSKE